MNLFFEFYHWSQHECHMCASISFYCFVVFSQDEGMQQRLFYVKLNQSQHHGYETNIELFSETLFNWFLLGVYKRFLNIPIHMQGVQDQSNTIEVSKLPDKYCIPCVLWLISLFVKFIVCDVTFLETSSPHPVIRFHHSLDSPLFFAPCHS